MLGLNVEELGDYIYYLAENNQHLKDNEEAASQVALAYERVSTGLSSLSSNIDDYNAALQEGNEDTQEYADAILNIEKDLQNIFNTDESIGEDFIVKHYEDIQAAAEGSVDAVHNLQQAYAETIVDIESLEYDELSYSKKLFLYFDSELKH